MSVSSAIDLIPSVFGGGGGGGTSLPFVKFSNPAPVTYTTDNEVVYSSPTPLVAGTYLISTNGLVTGVLASPATTQEVLITVTDDLTSQNEIFLDLDFTNGNSIQITALQTYSVATTLKIYIEAINFQNDTWELDNFDISIIKIA